MIRCTWLCMQTSDLKPWIAAWYCACLRAWSPTAKSIWNVGWGWLCCCDAREISPILRSALLHLAVKMFWEEGILVMKERHWAWTTIWGKLLPICKTGFVLFPSLFPSVLCSFFFRKPICDQYFGRGKPYNLMLYLPSSLEAIFEQYGVKLDLDSHFTVIVYRLYITEALWMTGSEVGVLILKCLWAVCFYVWIESWAQKSLEHLDWQQRDLKPPFLVTEGTNKHYFRACPPILKQSGCVWEDFPDRVEI